jgi:hypothetical protein
MSADYIRRLRWKTEQLAFERLVRVACVHGVPKDIAKIRDPGITVPGAGGYRINSSLLLELMRQGIVPAGLVTAGSAAPPNRACFCLDLLLGKADREIIGDLEEEFTTKILPERGARRARFWFWKQTAKTIAIRNPVCRGVLVYGLTRFGEWILRLISG